MGLISNQACFERCWGSCKALRVEPSPDGGCPVQPLHTRWFEHRRLQGHLCAFDQELFMHMSAVLSRILLVAASLARKRPDMTSLAGTWSSRSSQRNLLQK